MNGALPKQSDDPLAHVSARLLPTTLLVFAGYLVIGLESAAVPWFVHLRLGLSAQWSGLALSAQFAATLLNRPFAGPAVDRLGARSAALWGLLLCAVSAAVFASADSIRGAHLAWATVVLSRLILGFAMSWLSTAGTVWGLSRVGSAHATQVVAWSGVASYGSLALGSPLGLWLVERVGAGAVGACALMVVLVGAGTAWQLPDAQSHAGDVLRFGAVLRRVTPFGLTLASAAVGFGFFLSLITLLFEARGWAHAGLPLTLYGVCFVLMRLVGSGWTDRLGVRQTALLSLAAEMLGLLLLAGAHTAGAALVAAAVIGSGFSLVFPALCVGAMDAVEPRNRASAVSVFTGYIELSFAITAALSGWVLRGIGFSGAFLVAAALVLVAGVATAWALRWNHPHGMP